MSTSAKGKGKEPEEAAGTAPSGELAPSDHLRENSQLLSKAELGVEHLPEHHQDIKVKHMTAKRFPKEYKNRKRNTTQRFFVVRAVFPEDVEEVGSKALQEKWGKQRVAIQLIAAMPTEESANLYAKTLADEVDDAFNYYVLDMYEWIELPPDEPIPDADDVEGMAVVRKQPLLQEYMDAFNRKEVESAELMKMRIEMSKDGAESTDVMTPEHRQWATEQRIKNLEDILNNAEQYPDMMINMARNKLIGEFEEQLKGAAADAEDSADAATTALMREKLETLRSEAAAAAAAAKPEEE